MKPPRSPEQKLAQSVKAMAPGSIGGRVASARPVRPRPRVSSAPPTSGGASLHVGPDEPVNGEVFWYDTDATCP